MSYIDGSLLAGEHVIFRTRLHWKLLIGPVLLLAVALLPAAWLIGQNTWSSWALIPPALGLLILLARNYQAAKFGLRGHQQARHDEGWRV